MNPDNGRLIEVNAVGWEPAHNLGYTVQVRRELTQREKDKKQIKMYSPCGCGSGEKFKFCCWTGKGEG